MTHPVKSDYLIIGAGIYGLCAALHLAKQGKRVTVLEADSAGFGRGSLVNQARVHNGYHYPRSYSTAIQSARSFERFVGEFGFAINQSFTKIYALARKYSLTSADQFRRFCLSSGIPCTPIDASAYFNDTHIEAAFETKEYAFDARLIYESLLAALQAKAPSSVKLGAGVTGVDIKGTSYTLTTAAGTKYQAETVINATYASTNQIHQLFGVAPLPLKYELCEVILADVPPALRAVGLTVMDGPFFSLMPFGRGEQNSLTTVGHTPHQTSYENEPAFTCQHQNSNCSPTQLDNCLGCQAKPHSAWPYMSQLAKKYLHEGVRLDYQSSLFTVKPILRSAEIDDSRPTLIREYGTGPRLITVFSGKINGFYYLTDHLDTH